MSNRLSVGFRDLAVFMIFAAFGPIGAGVTRAAEEIDIAGEYHCRGANPGGGSYSGKVVITKTDQTYRIQWKIGTGQGHVGVGIREGDILSVCFVSATGVGVVSYKIQKAVDGPRLVGRWAGFGGKKTQSETLTRGAPAPESGTRPQPRITKLLLPAQADAT